MDKWPALVITLLLAFGVWLHGFFTGSQKATDRLTKFATESTVVVTKKVTGQEAAVKQEGDKERERIVYRDRFVPTIIKEIEYVTDPLATCPVSADSVRMWNKLRSCSLHPSEAGCGPDSGVPNP